MQKFVRELRRREVFRTAGLYIGISWLLIEVTSVVLPTFDAPDWLLQGIIVAAIIGFPIVLTLAWVFDLSSRGVEVQADATDTVIIPFGGRRMDFIVIAVLSVALVFSVYMNVTSGPALVDEQEPVSILIAAFDNQTGEDLLGEVLVQTLARGIEQASFTAVFSRVLAGSELERIQEGSNLDADGAGLIARREGIQLVLGGSVNEDNGRYQLNAYAVNTQSGERVFELDEMAADKSKILRAAAALADQAREELGDRSTNDKSLRRTEELTSGSLEAEKALAKARNLATGKKFVDAIAEFEKALALDPGLGRAHVGWALAQFELGNNADAEDRWKTALSFMDSVTGRERLRMTGQYNMAAGNYSEAIESYMSLVGSFPADGAGHNELALAYFSSFDFAMAMQEGQAALGIYPNDLSFRQNNALFAMYVGDFDVAETTARGVVEQDATRYRAWLPVAIGSLARDDFSAAKSSYEEMAASGPDGASLANLGLADLAMYRGSFAEASALLQQGIELDLVGADAQLLAARHIARAESLANLDLKEEALAEIEIALGASRREASIVPAALLYLQLGLDEEAIILASELSQQVQKRRAAYGNMVLGVIDSRAGRHVEALGKLNTAVEYTDSWLARFFLGQAYLAAGSAAEALDEFEICLTRRGETSGLFFDDFPTWRYLAPLPYWRGRAQQAVGMSDAATRSYTVYLRLRGGDDRLAKDANTRMSSE